MSRSNRIAEKNARVRARGDYIRWLAKRFGDLDLLLTMQGEDRVNLRKVYVPLRLDTKDRADESMGSPDSVNNERLPGHDARDLMVEKPFVAISGRPGSGKTTLVQALIGELAGDAPSEFRRRLASERGILPVPLILREHQDVLDEGTTLDDLLRHWWQKAEREARDKGMRLDVPSLWESYSANGDRIPLLVLFDGIDEVGGIERRSRVLRLANDVLQQGWRALVTGRPTGFDGLSAGGRRGEQLTLFSHESPHSDAIASLAGGVQLTAPLHHVQPFAWPQIRDFIERFYHLRQEWQSERERLASDFHTALADPRRDYLLNLARRPIFLTLMALVHANDRRMPHGRADLYRRILDLYLVRQTQQRRLGFTTRGEPMPHWDEREVRRALGYLAWRSQHRAAEADSAEQRDQRQVIWSRAELESELVRLLGAGKPSLGRFADLGPGDAPRLLDYFLHPTGLLVDPAEDRYQFAHLSFQEYLCAEYIHGRAKARGTRRFLDEIRELLYRQLGLPGWDEVGMLLLCIHAAEGAQAERTAHLELLVELDPSDLPQARLLISALTGKELDYPDGERRRWLPVAVAVALVQPEAGFAERFSEVSEWTAPGLELLRTLFRTADPFDVLMGWIGSDPPCGLDVTDWQGHAINGAMRKRWRQPRDDDGWDLRFGDDEGRAHALLMVTNDSGWVPAQPGNEDRVPLADPGLERALTDWLTAEMQASGEPLLYRRDSVEPGLDRLPVATTAALELDRLVPDRGAFWAALSSRVPLDAWLLQGEGLDDPEIELESQSIVLLTLAARDPLPLATRLAVGLCQVSRLGEARAGGVEAAECMLSRYRSLEKSWYLSLPRSESWARIRSRSLLRSRPLSRSLLRSRPLSRSLLRSRPLSRSQSVLRSRLPLHWLADICPNLPEPVYAALRRAVNQFPQYPRGVNRLEQAMETFGYRYAALDWFDEQAKDPDLMRRRGLRPGEPLPSELGVFDETGRIRERLPREALVRLRHWVDDDDALLDWFFPEGLPAGDDGNLREQLHTLHHYERSDGGRGQPWSPKALLDAVLADWPEEQAIAEVSLAAAERDLLAAIDELFPE